MTARCHRCSLTEPPTDHDRDCLAWHQQMAWVERAAKAASKASPSSPVTGAQAVDLLAHLRTRRVPGAEHVVQLALDLGWRPFQGALAVSADVPDPMGTGDLFGDAS